MLTVILLVVLAGSAGVLAVWLVDPSSLSRVRRRPDPGSLRSRRGGGTAPPTPAASTPSPGGASRRRRGRVRTGQDLDGHEPDGPDGAGIPVDEGVGMAPGAPRRRHRGPVPDAFTAVEGTYREVAVTPAARKVASAVLLLCVLSGAGVIVAAVLGATVAVGAELVDPALE